MSTKHALNFILQMDDRLSPTLEKAESNYERFTRALEKFNKAAYEGASSAAGEIAGLFKHAADLPAVLDSKYRQAVRRLQQRMKPLTQEVRVEITEADGRGGSVGEKVAKILKEAEIRLSASLPLRRSPFFDRSDSMRAQYRGMVQPPDMKGKFQRIPRFAEGGIVEGPSGEIDKILAYLTPGEMVLPKEVTEHLRELDLAQAPEGIKAATKDVFLLSRALDHVKRAAELGLDPEAPEQYREGLERLKSEAAEVWKVSRTMSVENRRRLNPALREIAATLERVQTEARSTRDAWGQLLDTARPVRFLAIIGVLEKLQSVSRSVFDTTKSLLTAAEGGEVQTYTQNMIDLRKSMPLAEARRIEEITRQQIKASTVGATAIGHATSALLEMGARASEIEALGRAVAEFEVGTTGSASQAAKLTTTLSRQAGVTRDVNEAILATIGNLGELERIDAGRLTDSLSQNFERMGMFLRGLPEDVQGEVTTAFAVMQAAVEQMVPEAGDAVADMIAKATQMTDEGRTAAAMMGMSVQQVRDAIEAGRMDQLVSGIASEFEGLDEESRRVRASIMGLDLSAQQLDELAQSTGRVSATMRELETRAVRSGDGMESLNDRVRDTMTVSQRLASEIGTLASRSLPGLDTSVLQLLQGVQEMNPALLFLAGRILKKGLLPVLTKAIVPAITLVTAKMWALTAAMLANPVGMVIAAVAAIVAGVALLIVHWDKVIDALKWTGDFLKRSFIGYLEWVGSIFDGLSDRLGGGLLGGFIQLFNPMRNFARAMSVIGTITRTVGDVFGWIIGIFRRTEDELVGHSLVPAFEFLGDVLGLVGRALDKVGDVFLAVWDRVKSPAEMMVGLVSRVAGGVGRLFGIGDGAEVEVTASVPEIPSAGEIEQVIRVKLERATDEEVRDAVLSLREDLQSIVRAIMEGGGVVPAPSPAPMSPVRRGVSDRTLGLVTGRGGT